MQGHGEHTGIAPRLYEAIFNRIEQEKRDTEVKVSMFAILGARIYDLLQKEQLGRPCNLHVDENKRNGVFIKDLTVQTVKNPEEIKTAVDTGFRKWYTSLISSGVTNTSLLSWMIQIELI